MNKATNDYELIYLVQSHQDGVALEYMFKKYERMIWKYIILFQVDEKDKDDFFQEGLILLNKAILLFSERYNKTFTRYFELIVRRHIIYLKNKSPKTLYYENLDLIAGNEYIVEEEELSFSFKTKLENTVYTKYFLKRERINTIALELKLTEKQVYNAIFRVKKKIKDSI
ncbi:hypothetical protein LJC17_01685 [Acholeplasma sp. OttesenSCG-928-E16]|nr:hypothetical protein [Acholeplasma sp. OttesenSCG-928-E16]